MRHMEEKLLSDQLGANGTTASPTITKGSLGASPDDLLQDILTSLDDDKAEDVAVIGLAGKSEIADHMVIASGRSSRQVVAMADHLIDRIKAAHGFTARTEGRANGDWVLIDCTDVIVHIFRPEVREFYQLEKMWMDPSPVAAKG